jgi:hypothetical protein
MIYDIAFIWPWLILALILGGAVGRNADAIDWQESWRDSWIKRWAIVLVVALIIDWLHIFPGRFAFWWETAILFAAAYLIGGILGGYFRRAPGTTA